MLDFKELATNFREPVLLTGRWSGAGASVPTAVALTTRGTGPTNTAAGNSGGPITISRSGVGTLAVQLPAPYGVPQTVEFWINSNANDKNVRTNVASASTGLYNLQVTYHANGTAVDVAAGEELDMFVMFSLINANTGGG